MAGSCKNSHVVDHEQEGWLAKHAADGEDEMERNGVAEDEQPMDPMQGLEGLDVAGPKPA